MYEGATYEVPAQRVVDDIMLAAKKLVLSGEYMQMPMAIPPPRGRPLKDAGVRKRGFYEEGATKNKKRAYTCSLCMEVGHKRGACPMRQMFDEDDEEEEDEEESE